MLGSANLGPSVFYVFYYNLVKRGPFATPFCTHSVTERKQMLQIWLLYDLYFLVCAYIAAKS